MKRLLAILPIMLLACSPALAVQTGGAGPANPVVIKGAITAEGYSKAPTLEITSGVTKLGAQTYTWPASLGSANSFLKDGGSGELVWDAISGTVPDPTAAGSLLIGTDAAGTWQSNTVSGDISITSTGVTTIAAEAVTGDKLANQILKSGVLDDAAYSLTFSNEGTGDDSMSSKFTMKNSAGALDLLLVSQSVPESGGIAGIQASKYLMINSPGIQIEVDEELELRGTIYTKDLSPSLYVKTDASSKLTAEVLSLDGVALDEGKILIGDGSNQAAAQTVSGDVTMTSTGVTTIAAEAVTGDKLANQILKIGNLGDAAYSITFSNEGSGAAFYPDFPVPMTSALKMQNSAGYGGLSLIGPEVEDLGGALMLGSNNLMFLRSPISFLLSETLILGSPNMVLSTDNPDGTIKFISDDGEDSPVITEIMTLDYDGTVTVHNLAPSLYVKTDASSNLTAEAIDLSSGMSGTLGALYGGTGISSYPPSGEILIGDDTNYNLRIISGDVSMNYLGEVAIRDGRISTSKLASDFILPINRGGTGITTTPMGPQILLGYMGSYSLRTVSGDVTMDYLGNYTIGSGKITADKLASNFTLPVNRGGTGATIYPTGEIVFGSGTAPLGSSSNFTWDNSNKTIVVGQVPGFYGETGAGLTVVADDYIDLGGISGGGNTAVILGAVRGTLDSPTALQEEDHIGDVLFIGHDGTGLQMGATIQTTTTQNWGANAYGTALTLTAANNDDSGETTLVLSDGSVDTNADLFVQGSASIGSTLEVSGSAVYVPGGDYVISDAGIGADLLGSKVLLIKGDSSLTDVTANPQIAAGADGQMLILIGRDDTALVKFNNGNGLQLSAATSFTMGIGDVLQLVYVQSIGKWVEISRTDN